MIAEKSPRIEVLVNNVYNHSCERMIHKCSTKTFMLYSVKISREIRQIPNF